MTMRSQATASETPGGSGPRTPIRLSFPHRVRSAMRLVAPALVFCGVVAVIAWLWTQELRPTRFVGHANRIEAVVVTPDDGMISNVWFKLHEEVKAGVVVADVVTTDPRTVNSRLAVMRGRMALTQLEMSPVLNQQRNSLDYAQLSIQAKRLNVEIATDNVSLDHERLELKRHERMFKDKLISEEMMDLQSKKVKSLETAIREKTELQRDMQRILEKLSFLAQTFVPGSENDPLKQALRVQEGQTKALEAKIAPLELYSPLDGVVTALYHASGENVLAGEPVLRVLAKKPDRIVAQMPVNARVEPQMGMLVRVTTQSRPRQEGWGEVMGVNPGYNANTNVTVQPSVPLTYFELSVSVPKNMNLKPGQPVELFFDTQGRGGLSAK